MIRLAGVTLLLLVVAVAVILLALLAGLDNDRAHLLGGLIAGILLDRLLLAPAIAALERDAD